MDEGENRIHIQLGDSRGLPLNFKSTRIAFPQKKNKKKNKNKKSTKRRNSHQHQLQSFSENRSEHNIYMGYNSYDGLFYPCRVVGVGPSSISQRETSIVYYFGYCSYAEVSHLFVCCLLNDMF